MQHYLRRLLTFVLFTGIVFSLGTVLSNQVFAKSAKEIDILVEAAMERFRNEVKGSDEFLKSAKGVLIIPGVIKGGLVIGGEYGEGALMIDGKTVDYYSTAAASYGFQLGGQKKDIMLIFIQEDALKSFRNSSGWKAGVDGSVALVNIGTGASIDTTKINEPIVGFVFGQKGLMYNLTLEGSKFSKLKR